MRYWILKKVRYLEPLKSCCPRTVSGRYKNTVKIKEPNKTCSLYTTNSILRQNAVKQHWASKNKIPSSKILVIIRWHYSANNFSVVTFLLIFNFVTYYSSFQFSSVQSLSRVQLFVTPWITARQASLSITISQSSLRLMSIESVMPSSHLILGRPLLLLPPIPPSIRVFSNESTLHIRWQKYWSFSFSIIPSKEIPGLTSFRMDWLDLLQSKGLSRVFSNTTVQKHQFFNAQLSSQSNPHIYTWPLEKL